MHVFNIKKVHISQLRAGDTVLINNHMQTVGKNHIRRSDLFGYQYKGYCYNESKGFLDVVLFPRFYKGERIG